MMLLHALIVVFSALSALATSPAHDVTTFSRTTVLTTDGTKRYWVKFTRPGLCETTHGVDVLSGYIHLGVVFKMVFWFFQYRGNHAKDPITLWLDGGPRLGSLIGLFVENGPCLMNTTNQTKPIFNPYSLKNPTNMLYLSQPIGVGFSYGSLGTPNQNITTQFVTTSTANALKVLFSSLVLILPLKIIRTLNIFAQSYGSHFGPVLASSIVSQTRNITSGHPLSKMGTLGIINGLVTVEYHYLSFPAFALHNSHYPIINASAYDEWTAAYSAACQALLAAYFTGNPKTPTGQDLCSTATTTCSEWSTEVAHYNPDLDFSEFKYDVRPGHKRPTHEAFKANLNHPDIQYNLTRSPYISYTDCDDTIYSAFYFSRDYVYRDFDAQLGELLDAGVRVALVCGDVNWLYNWMGGEAMALVISHKGKDAFGKTEYEPFLVDDEVVGETKEFGNLSFTRVYDAGRIVPVDQPVAALELLKRAVGVKRVADGKQVKNAVSSPGY